MCVCVCVCVCVFVCERVRACVRQSQYVHFWLENITFYIIGSMYKSIHFPFHR